MTPVSSNDFYDAMASSYMQHTGFDPAAASDVGIRFRVLAEELSHLSESACSVWRDAFPQTAVDDALDLHAQRVGLARKPALPSGGTLRFSRTTPAPGDVSIPAGTTCAASGGEPRFETTTPATIPSGALFADVPAVSLQAGATGNLSPGAVGVILSALPGVSSVTNPGPFTGGHEPESDDELRTRIMTAISDPPTPANAAWYRDRALAFPGVREASVLPSARGPGSVDLIIAALPGYDPDQTAAALAASLEPHVLVGVDLRVAPAQPVKIEIAAMATVYPGYDAFSVLDRCKAALAGYIAGLSIGAPLLRARLTACMLSVDGVENLRIVQPAQDKSILPGQIAAAYSIDVERAASL